MKEQVQTDFDKIAKTSGFSEKEIKMIQELYHDLPERVFNKTQNVRKKAWIQNYNKELDKIYFDKSILLFRGGLIQGTYTRRRPIR